MTSSERLSANDDRVREYLNALHAPPPPLAHTQPPAICASTSTLDVIRSGDIPTLAQRKPTGGSAPASSIQGGVNSNSTLGTFIGVNSTKSMEQAVYRDELMRSTCGDDEEV